MEISTTTEIEKKMHELQHEGVPRNFHPTSIDLFREYNKYTKNKKNLFDPIGGYARLIENEHYKQTQIEWLKDNQAKFPNWDNRFIVRLPKELQRNDEYRDVIKEIQEKAEIKVIRIPINRNETLNKAKLYFTKNKGIIPIIDLETPISVLRDLLIWALKSFEEVVLLNAEEFSGNEAKYDLICHLSRKNPHKIHFYGAYWNITDKSNQPLLATVFACSKFKSVSFQRVPIPRYLFRYIHNMVSKSEIQKIENSIWIDEKEMVYKKTHPKICKCMLNEIKIKELISINQVSVEACVIHHNLFCLSSCYMRIINDEKQIEEILNLDSIREIIKKFTSQV